MGNNGKNFVIQHLDYMKIAEKLEKAVFNDLE